MFSTLFATCHLYVPVMQPHAEITIAAALSCIGPDKSESAAKLRSPQPKLSPSAYSPTAHKQSSISTSKGISIVHEGNSNGMGVLEQRHCSHAIPPCTRFTLFCHVDEIFCGSLPGWRMLLCIRQRRRQGRTRLRQKDRAEELLQQSPDILNPHAGKEGPEKGKDSKVPGLV